MQLLLLNTCPTLIILQQLNSSISAAASDQQPSVQPLLTMKHKLHNDHHHFYTAQFAIMSKLLFCSSLHQPHSDAH